MRGFPIWSQNWNRLTFDPSFSQKLSKTLKNWQNSQICHMSTVFWAKRGLNFVRFQFWDQIWNPLILAHLSDPKNKENWKIHFLTPIRIFKTSTILRGSLHLTGPAQISYTVFWYHKANFETLPLFTFQKKMFFFTPPYCPSFKLSILVPETIGYSLSWIQLYISSVG